MTARHPTICISAGEVSGERYGARLVNAIQKRLPQAKFVGMGGDAMAGAGVDVIADLTRASTIGFVEPIAKLPKIWAAFRRMSKRLGNGDIDAFIPIDFQGFNMALLGVSKKLGIPSAYYIAPQEWQWGSEAGGRKVLGRTDLILSIFAEEDAFYRNLGGQVAFVGHPILDLLQPSEDRRHYRQARGIAQDRLLLSIFPGTRTQEIKWVYPIFLKTAKKITEAYPTVVPIISIPNPDLAAAIQTPAKALWDTPIFEAGNAYNLMAAADLSLATSGTVTLEHAIMGTPLISAYKLSPFSYAVAKRLVGKKFAELKYFTLPNLLLKQRIVPEFLQDEATEETLFAQAEPLLRNADFRATLGKQLKAVNTILGEPGAEDRAAEQIQLLIEKRP